MPWSPEAAPSGWDLKKALGLFAKSNPPLLEWLRSPIVYREASSLAQRLRERSTRSFSSRSCMHHYFHMAEGNYREYLCGDPVRVKKYFYVLRPVHTLLERKRSGDELAAGPRIPEINAFLDDEMGRLSHALAAIPRGSAPDWEALDGVFRESLVAVWDGRRTGT